MTEEAGIFKPDAKNIEKIFGDVDSFYLIPEYQRPYSWEDEHIEQLWDDLIIAMESKDLSYFLGPMILIKPEQKEDRYLEVVDGQQRLTTLTILFCVIRDLFKDELEKIDKALINKILNAIKSMVDENPRLKLITQLYYQNKFENEILNKVMFPTVNLTKKQREKEKFINAALILKEKLEEIKENKKNGIEVIRNFANYLLTNVEMITITCTKRNYAIKLFQVINTRGLELSPEDLVKSYLYGRISDKREQDQFMATWGEIETLSKHMGESITNLLTYYEYYLLAQNPKQSLYEELIDKFKNQVPNKIIYEFKEFIDYFYVIWKIDSKLIFSFSYLPNQIFWKAILTTAKRENSCDFEGLSKELRKVFYTYWVAGYTSIKIKQLSFNLIGWIKEKKKLGYIKEKIEQKMKEDNVIKRMNENLQNDVYSESWLKPLLALIEYNQTDDSKILLITLDRKIHADHILPVGWSSVDEWKEKWNKEQADTWLNKIGNLTLLSGKKNLSQQNDPPKKKADMYKKGHGGKTSFEISKNIIPLLEKNKWVEESVSNRQRWSINQIKSILGLE